MKHPSELHGIDALRLVSSVARATAPHAAADRLPQTPYAPSQAHNQSVVRVIRLTDINDWFPSATQAAFFRSFQRICTFGYAWLLSNYTPPNPSICGSITGRAELGNRSNKSTLNSYCLMEQRCVRIYRPKMAAINFIKLFFVFYPFKDL